VFIVLDSIPSNGDPSQKGHPHSIVTLNKVAYHEANGKMEIEMQRYLDTFPFDYFVILRDVTALPETLSSTLRQFFERLAEE
jgi:midasin